MAQRIRVGTVDEFPPGTGRELAVGDLVLGLYNVDGHFYASDGICPHAGGPLGKGALDGSVVTCPWHGWQFDVTSGQHCLNAKVVQATFPVAVEGRDIFVEVP